MFLPRNSLVTWNWAVDKPWPSPLHPGQDAAYGGFKAVRLIQLPAARCTVALPWKGWSQRDILDFGGFLKWDPMIFGVYYGLLMRDWHQLIDKLISQSAFLINQPIYSWTRKTWGGSPLTDFSWGSPMKFLEPNRSRPDSDWPDVKGLVILVPQLTWHFWLKF